MEFYKSYEKYRNRLFFHYLTSEKENNIKILKKIVDEIHKDFPQVSDDDISIRFSSDLPSVGFILSFSLLPKSVNPEQLTNLTKM